MDVKVDSKKIIGLRTKNAWSQQHLADVASISLRTIQRIEKSGNASQESVKSIASAFSIKPDNILLSKKEKFSFKPNIGKYLSAVFVAGMSSILYASLSMASPIMLKVNASSQGETIASVRLLNSKGSESEMRIDETLKLEISAKQTPENKIRLEAKLYEYEEVTGFKYVANPTLITEFNKSASINFTGSNGVPFEIQVTPEN